jgi:hypothetical protein
LSKVRVHEGREVMSEWRRQVELAELEQMQGGNQVGVGAKCFGADQQVNSAIRRKRKQRKKSPNIKKLNFKKTGGKKTQLPKRLCDGPNLALNARFPSRTKSRRSDFQSAENKRFDTIKKNNNYAEKKQTIFSGKLAFW